MISVVLIHGAWQGSWTFEALVPLLEADGIDTVAIDLPGNGADDTKPEDVTLEVYCDAIEATIDDLDGPSVLVGHSGGGVIATAAAERFPNKVAGVVFLAGMCLPQGMDFGELQELVVGPGQVFGITADIAVSNDGLTSTVPVDAAARYFLNDYPHDLAVDVLRQLTPQPEGGRFVTSPTTPERFGRLPKLYIEATRDLSMVLDAQRMMQRFIPEMPVVSLDTGHVPQFTDPDGVANALLDFIASFEETGRHA